MDDAGTLRRADAGDLREPRQQAVDEGAVGVAGTRMDNQPSRLVDNHDRLVHVDDAELDPVVGLRRARCTDLRRVDGDAGAGAEPHLARPRLHPVDLHRPFGNELGGDGSADVGEEGDHPVEALAVEGGGNLLDDHVARNEVARSRMAPTTIAASATLNTGHH